MNTMLSQTQRAELLKTVASSSVPERITSRSVTSITRIAGTQIGGASVGGRRCRVVCTAHGYSDGAVVHLSGANEDDFNTDADGALITVVDADTFDVMLDDNDGDTSATGTLVCYADIWVRQATVLGKKAAGTVNAGNVSIGTKSADGAQPYVIAPDGEAFLPAGREGAGPRINLADWFVDVATNGDGVYVLYF